MVPGLLEQDAYCPYCGESITLLVDGSLEYCSYTEDCSVCCQPMLIHASVSAGGELQSLQVTREDETG